MNPQHKSQTHTDAARTAAVKAPAETVGTPDTGLAEPEIVMLQRQLGNRAVQRMLADNRGVVPAARNISVNGAGGAQRHIQRNVFHDMFRGYARKNIFGKNKDRRAISKDTATVKKSMSMFFKNVTDVSVKSGNQNLAGRLYKGVDKKDANDGGKYIGKTVLFLSGSGGSAETYGLDVARYYCVRGADVLAVNYRGFGGSKTDKNKNLDNSEITEQGLYDDSHAIFGYLTGTGVDPGNVIVHGFSLGGPVAAELVAHLAKSGIRVGGLVLHSPMDSVREQAKQNAPTRGIGAFAANAGGVILDLRQHLLALSKVDGFKDLAIHFMSGKNENDDQLDIGKTNVDTSAKTMGFTNTSTTRSDEGDHLEVGKHMKVAGKGTNRNTTVSENSLDRLFATPVDVSIVQPEDKPDSDIEPVVLNLLASVSDEAVKSEVDSTKEGGQEI